MKLGFVFDARFTKYQNSFYSVSLSAELLTDRYLTVFDEMVIVGRYKEVTQSPEGKLQQCTTDRIQFQGILDEGPLKRVFHFAKDSRAIYRALSDCDAVICRGWRGTSICRKLNKPYLIEVVNCAWDSYWNHGLLGKIVAPVMFMIRRITTYQAPFVLYVTNDFLQKRYPTKGKSVGVSDVSLQEHHDEVLTARLKKIAQSSPEDKLILGTAAAVDVPFKGQRFVIRALAQLKKQGITNIEYQMAGGGDQSKLIKLAEKLDVLDQVVFKGSVVHDEIFSWFDTLDIYLQPSLQEGLPRAMIEAMSRGLLCYGTKTGGIPELIPSECVCSNNYNIANKIAAFLKNYSCVNASYMAEVNFEKSKQYAANLLRDRRQEFIFEFAKSVKGEIDEKNRNVEDQIL